ncbi:MAG: hypothetical protein QOF62_172 [Pyrinomonadaceae bacterium]|jgi:hypothetical protein|nr:hypothetical protein [Pyrinomonadaceae bacterium]
MANLTQGESCTIPAGHDDAVVTNLDAVKGGSYDLVIDGNSTKKQIAAGQVQTTAIHKNEAVITNSGKAELSVPNCD